MDTAEKTKRTDPGKWMPETRLRAWSTLFCFVQNQISRQSIPIFITFSEAVFNHAEDLLPNGRKIMNADFLVLNGKKNQMEAGRFYEAVEQWLKDHPFTPQQTDPVLRTGNLDLLWSRPIQWKQSAIWPVCRPDRAEPMKKPGPP